MQAGGGDGSGASGVEGETRDMPFSKARPRVPLGARARALVPVPTYVSALHGLRVRSVSCGGRHTACVLQTGEWLSWGENACGQLGLGRHCSGVDRPRLVADRCPENSGFVQVACGWAHTMARSASGAVFACGLNAKGQLGTGDTRSRHVPARLAVSASLLDEVGEGRSAVGAARVPGSGEGDGAPVRGKMASLWRRGLQFESQGPSIVAAIAAAAARRAIDGAGGVSLDEQRAVKDAELALERQPAACLAFFADAGPGCGRMELLDREDEGAMSRGGAGDGSERVPLRAVHVSAGAHHSAIAGADGRMWTWGSAAGGRLGRSFHLEPAASTTLRLDS